MQIHPNGPVPYFTHLTRQSEFRCRLPPEPNTPSGPSGRWSICSPGCAVLRCHSADKSGTMELENRKTIDLFRQRKGNSLDTLWPP